MTLLAAQQLFARLVPRLLDFARLRGYEVSFGEVYRPHETQEIYALEGRGAKDSLHPLRLAIDLHLFRNGHWLTRTSAHEPLGLFWEALHPSCRWGGRFPRPDGNHYSLAWGGRA